MLDYFISGVINVFQWETILFSLLGALIGVTVGSLPGLSVTLAVALMLPFTFNLDPAVGMILLISVYVTGTYGGSISAILLKTPGTPASVATSEDGFALSQQGKSYDALLLALLASVAGGLISGLALIFIAPQIAKIALVFGPPEYFTLTLFGLTVIAGVSGKSLSKGITMGALGILLATIGLDPIQGTPRFTFGSDELLSGISVVPALIGMFAISEILNQTEQRMGQISSTVNVRKRKFSLKQFRKNFRTIFKSSIIGIIIGAIPGTGAPISSYISVSEARRTSKEPEKFGKGSFEAVAAAESGNNGVTGATLIPMMTLGIPGDVITAVLLTSLMIQGLTPGPQLFNQHGEIAYTIMVGFIFANIIMFVIGLFAIRWFTKVTNIPNSILLPIVIGLCLIGGYSFTSTLFTVWLIIGFGIFGYLCYKFEYPMAPLLIGIILGPLSETALRQSLIISDNDFSVFFTRPFSLLFLTLTVISILIPIYQNWRSKVEANRRA